MSEDAAGYGVSHIASAPEELKVGDRVMVIQGACKGKLGTITISHGNGMYRVGFAAAGQDFPASSLVKVLDHHPVPITFDDVDPVIFENDSPSEKFRKIAEEMCNTYERKNATYGNSYSDGFRRFGATQLVSRIYEKYCRVENLLCHNAENKVPDESVKDTLTDMSVMCICLRMLIEDNDFENVE